MIAPSNHRPDAGEARLSGAGSLKREEALRVAQGSREKVDLLMTDVADPGYKRARVGRGAPGP